MYETELGDRIGKTQGDGIAIPVMVTGLGDLITWEPSLNGLVAGVFRGFRTVGLGNANTFLTLARLVGTKHLTERLQWDLYDEAVAMHGALGFDESFIFVPLPSLGGPGTVDTLQKRHPADAARADGRPSPTLPAGQSASAAASGSGRR